MKFALKIPVKFLQNWQKLQNLTFFHDLEALGSRRTYERRGLYLRWLMTGIEKVLRNKLSILAVPFKICFALITDFSLSFKMS